MSDFCNKIGQKRTQLERRRLPEEPSDFPTSRAHSMNLSAKGLSVRFLTVTIPTGLGSEGSSTGKIRTDKRLAANRSKEPGSKATKRPVATMVLHMCMDNVITLGRGTANPRIANVSS